MPDSHIIRDHLKKFQIPLLQEFFAHGPERSVKAKKNIAALFVLKGLSVATSFVVVPLTLSYLTPIKYGIWLTLSSLIGWVNYFDIGLGNGLRNKFAEARANQDLVLARAYVSTTYVMLSVILSAIFLLFLAVNNFLDWARILNAPPDLTNELAILAIVVAFFFCLRFVFSLIGTLLIADQEPALNGLVEVFTNLSTLLVIYVLVKTTRSSLLYLGVTFSCASAVVPFLASVLLFRTRYNAFTPSIRFMNVSYARELVSLGFKFFILQIGALIIFSSSNIIITQLFSPVEVVPYNLAFKYFGIVSMIFTVMLTPFWSAYTEAYLKKDIDWINRTFRRLNQAWLVLLILTLLMVAFADTFFRFWIGKAVRVPVEVSAAMAAYVLVGMWCNIYVNFINGTGKIRLQVFAAVAIAVFNIPLAIIFAKYLHLGVSGVVLAPTFCLLPWCVVWPLQTKKILSENAIGIWGK